jgi:hypothetical protein
MLFEANVGLRSKARVLRIRWTVAGKSKQASKSAKEAELNCELGAGEGTICLLLSGDANDTESGPSYTNSQIRWVEWRIDFDYRPS